MLRAGEGITRSLIDRQRGDGISQRGGGMKLGMFAALFLDQPLERALDIAKELGLQAIEIGAGNFATLGHCNPEELLKDDDLRRKFVKAVETRGLSISALNCSGNPLHPDPSYSGKNTHELLQAMELADRIGVSTVISFAGCPGADEHATVPNWITCPWPPYYADTIQWQWEKKIVPFWGDMAKKARARKLRFAFEMHPGDSVYNPEMLLLLRDKVGMKEIACNLDPSHLFWQGIDPAVAIRRLGDAIVHVHAKDCYVEPSVVAYRGVLDWKHYGDLLNRAWTFRTVGYGHDLGTWNAFFSALKTVGYDGVISIEHEDALMSKEEGLRKAVEFLKRSMIFQSPGEMWWA
jgi:sugar phosphate isomerase/epimerase